MDSFEEAWAQKMEQFSEIKSKCVDDPETFVRLCDIENNLKLMHKLQREIQKNIDDRWREIMGA